MIQMSRAEAGMIEEVEYDKREERRDATLNSKRGTERSDELSHHAESSVCEAIEAGGGENEYSSRLKVESRIGGPILQRPLNEQPDGGVGTKRRNASKVSRVYNTHLLRQQ